MCVCKISYMTNNAFLYFALDRINIEFRTLPNLYNILFVERRIILYIFNYTGWIGSMLVNG